MSKLEDLFNEKPNEKTQPVETYSEVHTIEFEFVTRMDMEGSAIVKNNSLVKVSLAISPNSKGNWTITNLKEIEEVPNRIEYLGVEHIDSYDSDDCKQIHFPFCGKEIFSFHVKDATKGLPNIFFSNTEKGSYRSQRVALRYIEEPLEIPVKNILIKDNQNMKHEYTFDTESYAVFQFKGNFTEGYSWELSNYYDLRDNYKDLVELKEVDYKTEKYCELRNGCPYLKSFKFHIKELNKTLPKLNFVYRRSIDAYDEKEVTVTLKGKPLNENN